MDWTKELYNEQEKPLDRMVEGYSNTSIFRSIAFIGDSLSSGEFETRDEEGKPKYYDMYEYSWGQYIARKNGMLAYNFSRGGMTAKEYMEGFAEEKGFWDSEKACQAYVIALGVNDIFGKGMEVGSVEDIGSEKDTFIRYYADIVKKYKEISPNAKFFFVGFPKDRYSADNEKAAKAIKEMYALTEIFENSYMIDLYQYGPEYDEAFREKFYLYGHMNPMGYIFTARIIDSYIDYIIRHNPQDFDMVGFIGKNISK